MPESCETLDVRPELLSAVLREAQPIITRIVERALHAFGQVVQNELDELRIDIARVSEADSNASRDRCDGGLRTS